MVGVGRWRLLGRRAFAKGDILVLLLLFSIPIVVVDAFEVLCVALDVDNVVVSDCIVFYRLHLDLLEHFVVIADEYIIAHWTPLLALVLLAVEVIECNNDSGDVVTASAQRTSLQDGIN